jgi:hypothetical protein
MRLSGFTSLKERHYSIELESHFVYKHSDIYTNKLQQDREASRQERQTGKVPCEQSFCSSDKKEPIEAASYSV